ncbi:GP88 family protein [Embleya sp. NBC_00896]|uniref:GP88 family protein n=1 Tax=Embleya sp. NBC_00896 TaxID=2975961 RepID=UPI002F91A80F|nr:hypothetical protein OG928_48380 [Embleya sp. NBC_00896]
MSTGRPRLLTQNSRMRAQGHWNWTLPAWAGRLPDGRTYNTCPSAGVCAQLCYARAGMYRVPAVLAAHERNLAFVLDDPGGFETAMTRELALPRFVDAHVRVHDAGDFFDRRYLTMWLRIMRATPDTHFYAYTKEVELFNELVVPDAPPNFDWVFSKGGVHDEMITKNTPHADVFPDEQALHEAGYTPLDGSDLVAVSGVVHVGLEASRIPHLRKLQGRESFGSLQRAAQDRAHRRRARTQSAMRETPGGPRPGKRPDDA